MKSFEIVLFLVILGTLTVQSYVLVQVRKDQNKSNVDALIHKVVPPKKFEEIADTARKQFKNFNQFTIRNNADDKELESIVFAIKTDEQNGGMKQDGRKQYGRLQDSGKHHKLEHLIVKLLSYFKSPGKKNLPYYKMQLQKFNIKSTGLSNSDRQWSNFSEPEIITFRNNEKPSMMYEIDTKSILKSFKETLASKRFKKFVDKVVDNAAVIYRAIKHEISDIKN